MSAPSAPAAFQPVEISHNNVDLVQEAGEVPSNFIQVGCIAFRCDNLEWPGCIGCKSSGQVLCLEGDCFANQCYSDEDVCCVPESTACDLVAFEPRCNLYKQIFCFEIICNKLPPMGAIKRAVSGPNSTDPIICRGACCVIDSCLCAWPQCCMYSNKAVLCCLEGKLVAMKPSCNPLPEDNPRSCCLLRRSVFVCNRRLGKSWCKAMEQSLCCDRRSAFPCDEEVPCVWADCFLTCCASGKCWCGCCHTISSVNGLPPVQQQQQQQQQQQVQTIVIQQQPGQQQVVYQQQPVAVQGVIIAPAAEQVSYATATSYDKVASAPPDSGVASVEYDKTM